MNLYRNCFNKQFPVLKNRKLFSRLESIFSNSLWKMKIILRNIRKQSVDADGQLRINEKAKENKQV